MSLTPNAIRGLVVPPNAIRGLVYPILAQADACARAGLERVLNIKWCKILKGFNVINPECNSGVSGTPECNSGLVVPPNAIRGLVPPNTSTSGCLR